MYNKVIILISFFLLIFTKSSFSNKVNIPKTLYFAGSLFTHKDLVGNILLANSLEKISNGKYRCVLPQNLQQISDDPKIIRDNDLISLKNCDGIIANFDGTELDSGTVAEFMYAKFLNKPAVIFRSDFRLGGDSPKTYPWNLMLNNYPKTKIISLNNTILTYHSIMKDIDKNQQPEKILIELSDKLATLIVTELDNVFSNNEHDKKIDKFLEKNNMQYDKIYELYDKLIDIND